MKNRKFNHAALSLCLIAMAGSLAICPELVSAYQGGGQLSFIRNTTINGCDAVSGQTVFSRDKIKVGNDGLAIISLGKLGRVELGTDSEMTLLIGESNIGGTLFSGCLAINTTLGQSVEINTANGRISSPANQPSFFVLKIKENTAAIYSNLGEIKVTADKQSEIIKPGESVTVAAGGNSGSNLQRIPNNCYEIGSALCNCGKASAPISSSLTYAETNKNADSIGILDLFLIAVNCTKAVLWGLIDGKSSANAKGNGLTCVNAGGLFCKPIGPITP